MKPSCITIERQYGSGGREVGKLLSEKLGIPFYDGELLYMAADKFGLNPGVLKDWDEKRSGSILHDIAVFADSFQDYNKLSQPYQMFEAVSQTIRKLAMEGPCIFIGRCAGPVLKDTCKSLNIFIYASSMDERIKRATQTDRVESKNIESYIRQKDGQRRDYYKRFVDKEWGKMDNYDLCLNTSCFGYEGCADIIVSMAEYQDKTGRTSSVRKKE